MEIEICAQVYEYQKRFWWMLSSLVKQIGDIPSIKVTMNVSPKDRYHDLTRRINDTFYPLINLNIREIKDDRFQYRAFTRNIDIMETKADWILFADADIVFQETFFAELKKRLKSDEKKMITVKRFTMSPEDGWDLVNKEYYTTPIQEYEGKITRRLLRISGNSRKSVVGAGYFQLVNVHNLKSRVYAENFNRDATVFNKLNQMRCDRTFRDRIGGVLPFHDMPAVWHLNHYRAGDEKHDPTICH